MTEQQKCMTYELWEQFKCDSLLQINTHRYLNIHLVYGGILFFFFNYWSLTVPSAADTLIFHLGEHPTHLFQQNTSQLFRWVHRVCVNASRSPNLFMGQADRQAGRQGAARSMSSCLWERHSLLRLPGQQPPCCTLSISLISLSLLHPRRPLSWRSKWTLSPAADQNHLEKQDVMSQQV